MSVLAPPTTNKVLLQSADELTSLVARPSWGCVAYTAEEEPLQYPCVATVAEQSDMDHFRTRTIGFVYMSDFRVAKIDSILA